MPRPERNLIATLRGRLAPDTQQSAEVQANLVKSLYASPASLMIGAVAGGALGLVIAWHARMTAITVITVLICLVGLSRSISSVYFQRQLAHQRLRRSRPAKHALHPAATDRAKSAAEKTGEGVT